MSHNLRSRSRLSGYTSRSALDGVRLGSTRDAHYKNCIQHVREHHRSRILAYIGWAFAWREYSSSPCDFSSSRLSPLLVIDCEPASRHRALHVAFTPRSLPSPGTLISPHAPTISSNTMPCRYARCPLARFFRMPFSAPRCAPRTLRLF